MSEPQGLKKNQSSGAHGPVVPLLDFTKLKQPQPPTKPKQNMPMQQQTKQQMSYPSKSGLAMGPSKTPSFKLNLEAIKKAQEGNNTAS